MATTSSSLNQPASSSSASSTLYAQPTKNWVIPPRPKPGRKPKKESPKIIEDDATDEARKNQNRASQRAFRERRQDQLATLQARLQQYEQGETERYVQLQAIDKRLKEENDALRAELTRVTEENIRLKAEKAAHWANSKPEVTMEECPPPTLSRKRVTSTTSDAGVQSARKRSKTAISPPRGFDHHTDDTCPSSRHPARSMSSSGPFAIPHVPVSPVISMASSGLTPPLSTSATTPASQDQSISSPESQSSPSTSTIPSKTPIATATPCPARHNHNSLQAMHPFPSSSSGHMSSIPDSPPPPSEDSALVITNCGFCTDDTPCICREISRQGARQADILSISQTFGTIHTAPEEDVVVPSPKSSILDNLPPYQPPVPLRKRATQHASASSSSSSPLAPGLRKLKEPIFAVQPANQPSVEAQAKLAATCSGDPANCPVCKDDSFGQAFCSALSSACASGRCESCPSRQRQGLMPGLPPPEAMQPLCGSAPLGPPTTMPRSSAWATLKAHPASKTFNNLDLLAEVVVRGNNSRPGSRLSMRSTGERQSESDQQTVDSTTSSSEARTPCGERLVEVPMEGVRDALALLDEHWKEKGGRD
ncbi:hypothetical protein FRC04_007781 [Tulasnella sp. 424]|nr:hypothetical protein FRC04_007781 [Tulasnella sp. 424]KAG8975257.1 hypothetical protein FRC05_006200 [Tulasnella sp. 425]